MLDKFPILRATRDRIKEMEDIVVKEFHLTIILNDRELVTLLCSPEKLDSLAIGFLYSEGLINSRRDIKEIDLDVEGNLVRVATKKPQRFPRDILPKRLIGSSGGKGVSPFVGIDPRSKIDTPVYVSPSEVLDLVDQFVHRSGLFESTGGVHSAALCDAKSILVFSEDIGRHNAIDKVFGECLLKDVPIHDRLLVTSGRVSSEILSKAAKRRIPVLISKSAPTDLGVQLANRLGITLIGFVREKRMNIYTHGWRVLSHGK
jgi:FdhD protein